MMAIVFCLVCFGIVMVYSSTAAQAVLAGTSSLAFAEKQLLYAVLGGIAFLWCRHWDPKFLHRIAGLGIVVTMAALCAVLVPGIGEDVNGARRWIAMPVFGQIQPAEFAKLALVIWIAAAIARDPRRVMVLKGLLPYLAVTFAMAGLVLLEPDMGTATTLVFVAFAMLLVAGARPGHLALALAGAGTLAAVSIAVAPYRRARLLAFLHPWHDATGNGFQTVQAQIAVGSGGFHGVGLGEGLQKAFYLPEAYSDMILASIGEELGFIGITVVMAALAAVVLLAYRIAIRAPDLHQRLIATGLATLIAVQSLDNAGAALGVMPVTGVPLPFISYGGSSIMVLLAGMGLLVSISRRSQRASRRQPTSEQDSDRRQRDGWARDAGARRRGSVA